MRLSRGKYLFRNSVIIIVISYSRAKHLNITVVILIMRKALYCMRRSLYNMHECTRAHNYFLYVYYTYRNGKTL